MKMQRPFRIPTEISNVGRWLQSARMLQVLTQKELAAKSGIAQPRLSRIEKGAVLPTLPQLIRLARALSLPLQWFLNGSTVPGTEVAEIAVELHRLGVVDLLIPHIVVPGAFRPIEQVMALAVSGNQPNPRIIEAIPAVLAWNRWSHTLLRAYVYHGLDLRVGVRLAWLADLALTIHRNDGFPAGCPQRQALELYVRWWSKRTVPTNEDDLGRPARGDELPPVWKRWKIKYDAPLTAFVERARQLSSLRRQQNLPADLSPSSDDE